MSKKLITTIVIFIIFNLISCASAPKSNQSDEGGIVGTGNTVNCEKHSNNESNCNKGIY